MTYPSRPRFAQLSRLEESFQGVPFLPVRFWSPRVQGIVRGADGEFFSE